MGEGWRGHGGNRLRFICKCLFLWGLAAGTICFIPGVLFVTCARGRVLAPAGLAYVACLGAASTRSFPPKASIWARFGRAERLDGVWQLLLAGVLNAYNTPKRYLNHLFYHS